ncbi:hypothetical protein MNBD_GAMMA15-66 [hydrothermal vent metagenome]|uniref:Uncharacterized protein n=1 Tax=hydrothermal vent metagenome TaxID=652676 RepID=A0A3B0YJ81_9ZZZZ
MIQNKSLRTSLINTATNLLILSALLFSPSGYAKNKTGAWQFESADGFCTVSTAVGSDDNPFYVTASVGLTFYYFSKPVITDHCTEVLEQNAVSVLIYSKLRGGIQTGTHVLLQSKNLFNEQATALKFYHSCDGREAYTLDYRVTDLLLTDLLARENIRLTVNLENYGAMVGQIRTNGFEAAYEKLAECIDSRRDD